MSQAPLMPVFPDALLGDTMHLSTEEFGAYCLLLFVTWRNNGVALKDNEVELSRVCRVSLKVWRARMRAKLAPFFDLSGGTWRQRRLEKEWEWVARRAEVNRKNGSHGGRPQSRPNPLKTAETGNPTGSSRTNRNGTQNESTHTHEGSYEPSSVAKATGADAPVDPIKALWDRGLAIVGDTPPGRRVLGGLRKRYGDEAVRAAIAEAEGELPSEPVSFLEGVCLRRSLASRRLPGEGYGAPGFG
jgi:uncharacterized protein YdaU (DUF1376 family)